MARPREWERIARDLGMSLQAYNQQVLELTKELVMQSQDPWSRGKGLEIDRVAVAGLTCARELQGLIEDNDKSAADIEKQVLANYRIKGG